ncbi:MAG TPA: protein kinase [Gemmatimonadales bacterium]|jgi:serine/threonine-protein kinase|nr:protein kinase [Gemmatimonadales bacterium]
MPELLGRLQSALADRYRLERELGAGGMATVYLAHDLRHERRVALKLLRPELAAVIGAERFLGEIRTTANLQHPHILPLFDSGAADSFLYYVMPYVEGESLRARLTREKQLPIAEAVRLGSQVASALDYAHRHGVIHRDIKPENILLHEGSAVVADFGIALALSSAGRNRLTETGLSIGTPQYMSPEQAMGDRDIDARSDIYSLGAVLYEMLAGDPPFLGSTAQAIVAKVITEKPTPITASRDTVPPAVAATVHRALAKLPADRFGSAAELSEALAGRAPAMLSGTTTVIETPAQGRARRWLPRAGWALLGAAVVALAAFASRRSGATVDRAPIRFSVELAPTEWINSGDPTPIISPDGRQILIQAVRNGRLQIFLRDLARNQVVPVAGTEGGNHPFFSPDAAWIGFTSEGKLRKVRVEGGSPIVLAPSTWAGGSWGADGTIVYTESYNSGLWQVSAAGGEPTRLTIPDSAAGELAHWWPQILPDGRHVIFTNFSTPIERAKIELLDLRTGSRTVLVRGGVGGVYAASGHLLYGAGDALLAAPFDLDRLRLTGEAVPVLSDLAMVPSNGAAAFSVSASGDLAYVRASLLSAGSLPVWVSREGTEQPLLQREGRYASPAISPDGRRVALTVTATDGNRDVWAYEPGRGILTRITSGDAADFGALWTGDGRRLIYSSERPIFDLFSRAAGAGTPETALVVSRADKYAGSLSADGSLLLYGVSGKLSEEIWSVGLDGHPAAAPLLQGRSNLAHPSLSPTGGWLAFDSDESGRAEVYLQSFPDLARDRRQVSTNGGTEPRWTRGGRELVYLGGDSVFAVAVDPASGETGRPTLLFSGPYGNEAHAWSYDAAPDGRRFLMIKSPPESAPRRVEVVLNWFAELKGGHRK